MPGYPFEETVLIGGPYGDFSYFATDNPPGGVIQPGWRKGWRHGYKQDGNFISSNWNDLFFGVVEGIDEDHAVAIYAFQDTWDRTGNLKIALLKREDDALIDIDRDFVIGTYDGNQYANIVACVLSLVDGVAHIAFGTQGDVAEWPNYYDRQVGVVRVDMSGNGPVFTMVDLCEPYTWSSSYRWGPYQMVRLTDTKFAVAEFGGEGPPGVDIGNDPGFGWYGESWNMGHERHVLRIFELVNGSIAVGEPLVMGNSWGAMGIAVISESRVLLASLEDRRLALKARSEASRWGHAGRYFPGLHVRTCDIDGLTATENIAIGAVGFDPNATHHSSYEIPGVEVFDDGTAVVIYPRETQIAPSVWYRASGLYPGPAYSRLSVFDAGDPDPYMAGQGPTNYWYGNQNTRLNDFAAAVPAARLFTLGGDGSVTPTSDMPHILDASPTSWADRDWWEGFNPNAYNGIAEWYGWFQGFNTVKVDDCVTVGWASVDKTRYLNLPMNGVYRATVLRRDPLSPSGLVQHGFRHLSYIGTPAEPRAYMKLAHFPNTDWYCAVADQWTNPIVDSIEEGNPPPGTEDYPIRLWFDEHPEWTWVWGYSPAFQWGSIWEYRGFLYDDWEFSNVDDYLDKYGTYPSDVQDLYDWEHPRHLDGRSQLRISLYEITPPERLTGSDLAGMRIHRPGDHSARE